MPEIIRNLRLEDSEAILKLEKKKLVKLGLEDIEIQMESWKSRWREESLNYYLPKGWSFGLWNEAEQLVSYFVARVLPYFRSYTQVLWIENFSSDSIENSEKLIEIAYGYAKEKHLQKIMIEESVLNPENLNRFTFGRIDTNLFELNTAKNKD